VQKTISKSAKRIIVDYTQNSELENKIFVLENDIYGGLSRSEIAKLAIIELFKRETQKQSKTLSDLDLPIMTLTEAEEASLAESMKSKLVSMQKNESVSSFLDRVKSGKY